ncbi:flagellar biosynthetic protein FlhB [Rhizobium sp. SG_E_25_P2]|uniref:flagellar biosynthesis protein FlhB n=1 Tax=Rhizobium sp. SG_E_25_P2 TaxID=2879942 RepID=UPI002474A549|nr:flagellar biosynthesis protein FlhB [Rhizobium sp. SG_E_25_P2]MDH6266434.1 flagellar biosynthetic protein FlhB [Rhizobium sp. SG_E_25_P2]
MAESADKDSKTEAPTQKRYSEAADKGNVPFSREITVFASTLGIYVYFVFFLPSGVAQLWDTLRGVFEKPEQWRFETGTDIVALFGRVFWESAAIVTPAFILMATFGIAASILQNLPTPVLERIAPKFSRLNPAAGFGRLFGMPGMVEFGKSLIKILVVGMVVGLSLRSEYFKSLDAMYADPDFLLKRLSSDVRTILVIILFAAAIIAIADYFWTHHHWYEELKMTKEEIKEERKQTDGDPMVKQRQRSFARDLARKRMINSVPRATLVIANPTHYAVALRYVRNEDAAPVVVAKGTDLIALKIRQVAEENGVPVFEDPPLARSMFAQVSVDSVIPPVFYKAVAELIQRIYASKNKARRVH